MARLRRIACTTGEPAGVGPELAGFLPQAAAGGDGGCELVAIGDLQLLRERAACLQHPPRFVPFDPQRRAAPPPGTLSVLHVPLAVPSQPGRPDPANAAYVLACLDAAHEGCRSGAFAAMVTAPVDKGIICEAGVPFTGHTEYLQQRCGAAEVVMMLGCRRLKVALVTTHLPLREVSAAVTRERLRAVLDIVDRELRRGFALEHPAIFVSGLNPHAGEHGHLGDEELTTIIPVLDELRGRGLNLTGPLPADTMFIPGNLRRADVFVTMYHDQGLPVLKHLGFGDGYNVTLGLPYPRTSVDHGTALELAGSGGADPGSLLAAVSLAQALAGRRDGS